LTIDPNASRYVAEFGFSFTFLDTNGNSLLSAPSARGIREGGDLHGDVSIPMVADLNVGGLSMEFSDIRNAGIGGLPVTFGGTRFLIHNALFGEPFTQVPPITVAIDIKPGGFPNSINPKSKGVIPVAILTTNTFDATTVDSTTVLFGTTGTEAAPVHSALEDVDGDGGTDLILHFNTQDTDIVCGHTSASLTGETFGGRMIEGADSIKTVGCK
jgi:hypothetical protein